ncbi:putative carbonyl reductase [Stachybotrys elegans]|uniref:Carbonyl reductase n=1 Tax=Stachybotrys elegans TaxID=80388 RepID=A0A8K0SYK1_9HYPO|nr:putative carbonyl reductase [Stachybotrys elegans]
MTFHPDNLPDLSGRVYIITGGTGQGIGFYAGLQLAQHGAHVYLCSRSDKKGQEAVEAIQQQCPGARASYLIMDHMALASVMAAAKDFLSKEAVLHGLVNNAGIMTTPFDVTRDGYEAQWQTNYLAHWVFTFQLLPTMLMTSQGMPPGSVRIVNLSSGAHIAAPRVGINLADTTLHDESTITRYGQSKLANILHTKTLHKMYGPGSYHALAGNGEIWCTAVNPGGVKTGLTGKATEMPLAMRVGMPIVDALGGRWPADKGAWTSVFCVASPELKQEECGGYFERIAQLGKESCKGKDAELAEKLEEWTLKEVKERGFYGYEWM